jgi:hypothetical protein
MKLKNTFIKGKLNKDVDERLLPNGQYSHAENIKVANSESSDAGAIENSLGNEQLTNFNLTNAKTIGSFGDGSNQKVYWFTTSDEKDLVIEYDIANSQTDILLESSKPDSLLNFDSSFLITGVSKVINGESGRDLLLWTDDLNPPRMINIERAKTYGVNGFEEEDILLIKKPPRFAPETILTFTPSTLENNLEDKFLSFSYRYKYLDGEYSSLSSFSNYNFAPSRFELDYQTMENKGMVNSFNAISISFNTGSKRVTDIQLVVKESNSNALAIVETFNKEKENWEDNVPESFLFANSKKYTFLPEDELFRAYDNVPRKAKAMEIIGNRAIFGNYVEGYNLVNRFGEKVRLDYSLSLLSKDLGGEDLSFTLGTSTSSDDEFTFDLSGRDLKSGTKITLDIFLSEITYNEGSFSENFDFILNRNYTGAQDLAEDEEFILFVETIMTSRFNSDYSAAPPDDSELILTAPFTISGSTTNTISIVAPKLTYKIDNTPSNTSDNDFREEISNWSYTEQSGAFYKLVAIDSSIKTNRNYEVGIIYMDEYNRATTVLTGLSNTVFVPQEFSINQNKILVNLNHRPPKWADRYKIVVKQNKLDYQTIYTNLFYEEGLFRWVKLEGANINKVKEDDILIVKSDLGGPISRPVRVRVLELATKQPDFILENENSDGQLIVEEAGLYMKIKPSGFDMNFDNSTARTFEGSSHSRYPKYTFTNPYFGDVVDNSFVPFSLLPGSTVKVFIEFEARGSISYKETYDRTFKVALEHNSIKDWFNEEVGDLGSFGEDFTRDFGFTNDSRSFFVRAHRDGTASRKITTTLRFEVLFSEGIVIFETEPKENDNNIFYETEQTFEIVDDFHLGNTQSQSEDNTSAIIEVDFFNCYVQGNGAESYRVEDTFNSRFLNIDLRPTTTSVEEYKEVRRYADLTYSATYNENTNLNGLNEFNLSVANFKEDIDKRYGFIQKLYSRDTDLLVFQEDKVSRVLYGKDLLLNADGTSNISSIEDVLGQQIMYSGEYGISRNPESFDFDGYNIYFTDSKRGAVMRLSSSGLDEISKFGMGSWFRDRFKGKIDTKKIGAFDPYNNQYVVHPTKESFISTTPLTCNQSVSRSNFDGQTIFTMDFGTKTGPAGFDYNSNGVPVKYDIQWGNQTFTTGFVGDSSYNGELGELGLPDVSGSGNGTFTFNKDSSTPTSIKITVTAPICDASFTIGGNCIENPDLKVISVVLNDDRDENLTIISRYKWSTSSYNSPFKSYNSIFETGEVDIYDLQEGEEGTQVIPLAGSTIKLESFKGFTQTANFLEDNKLGYLVSNTLYTDSEIADLVSTATFPTNLETVLPNGDVLNSVNFTFNRPSAEEYLYMIWDYRDTVPSLPCGGSLSASGFDGVYIVEAQLGSETGEVVVEFDSTNIPDRFELIYDGQVVADSLFVGDYLQNTNLEDDIINVFTLDRFVYNGSTFDLDGQESVNFTSADIAVSDGTETRASGNGTGQIGVVANFPESTSLASNGEVKLTFNKTQPFPSTLTIRVTGVSGSTNWNIKGLQCPI